MESRVPVVGKVRGRAVWLGFVLGWLAVGTPPTVAAQETPADMAELNLAQLLDLDLVQVDVLGVHTHLGGEWMIGYRFGSMSMGGNRDGTTRLTDQEVLAEFPVAPTDMTTQMHMLHVMYASSDRLSLTGMIPYTRRSMDHVTRRDATFTTHSEGLGDITLGALVSVVGDVREDRQRLVIDTGVSLPTGSIDERGDTPAARDQRLPYPMQLGSGTVDLHLGASYLGQSAAWAWTAEAHGVLRLGRNDNDYALGDRLRLTGSGSRRLAAWLSFSGELIGSVWGKIEGADPELNPALVPTADPLRRGGRRVDLTLGVNVYVPSGALEGNRLALRVGRPLYQSLDGPQLETDWFVDGGWSWTF